MAASESLVYLVLDSDEDHDSDDLIEVSVGEFQTLRNFVKLYLKSC